MQLSRPFWCDLIPCHIRPQRSDALFTNVIRSEFWTLPADPDPRLQADVIAKSVRQLRPAWEQPHGAGPYGLTARTAAVAARRGAERGGWQQRKRLGTDAAKGPFLS